MIKENIKISLRKVKNITSLSYYFVKDFHFYYRCMWNSFQDKAFLLAEITKEAHRVEKGLTYIKFRENYGKDCIFRLLRSLEKFRKYYYNDIENVRIRWALQCLEEYSKRHSFENENYQQINGLLNKFSYSVKKQVVAGSVCVLKKDLLEAKDIDFANLAKIRVSIRQFKKLPVNKLVIMKCLEIAQETPSVCNRQGWKTHIIKDTQILKLFKNIHNGFAKGEQYLDCLLAITIDQMFFEIPKERHQGYIDGGLYAMSLMYALTSQGLASCPLNANLTTLNLMKMSKVLNLKASEKFIMFIAVGHFRVNNLIAVSQRDIEGAYLWHENKMK